MHKKSIKVGMGGYVLTSDKNKETMSYTKDGNKDLPKAKGNSVARAALINPDFDE